MTSVEEFGDMPDDIPHDIPQEEPTVDPIIEQALAEGYAASLVGCNQQAHKKDVKPAVASTTVSANVVSKSDRDVALKKTFVEKNTKDLSKYKPHHNIENN